MSRGARWLSTIVLLGGWGCQSRIGGGHTGVGPGGAGSGMDVGGAGGGGGTTSGAGGSGGTSGTGGTTSGDTLYVALDGTDDPEAGTPQRPFRTVNYAMDASRGGHYVHA